MDPPGGGVCGLREISFGFKKFPRFKAYGWGCPPLRFRDLTHLSEKTYSFRNLRFMLFGAKRAFFGMFWGVFKFLNKN